MEEGFKHWVGVKLTDPIIDGTVTTVLGLTMPAFTAAGDISLGTNKLKYSTYYLGEDVGIAALASLRTADDAASGLVGSALYFKSSINSLATITNIFAHNSANSIIALQGWTGAAFAEVARIYGAADPYFAMGSTQQFKFFNSGVCDFGAPTKYSATIDSAAVADTVSLGGFDIAAGHRGLAIGCEEVVVSEVVVSDRTLPVRINGVTYKILLKS